jgi:thiol-disulfide isomerase/thioredoxin
VAGDDVAGRRSVFRRRLIFTCVGCVLAGLLAFGLFSPASSGPKSDIKLPASLPSLEGGPAVALPKLGSRQAEPVVITFFASWCGPCESEMPAVARFYDTESADGVKVRFIGVDENDPTGGLAFTEHSGVRFPVGKDPDGVVLEDLGAVPALPQTIFINQQGDIVFHQFGSVTSGSVLQTWVRRITST